MPRPLERHGAGCVEDDRWPEGHGATLPPQMRRYPPSIPRPQIRPHRRLWDRRKSRPGLARMEG
jgi:hypothetical protein